MKGRYDILRRSRDLWWLWTSDRIAGVVASDGRVNFSRRHVIQQLAIHAVPFDQILEICIDEEKPLLIA